MPERWLERIDLRRFAPTLGLRLDKSHKVRCLSPSHEDKRPSMVVYPDGAHCHACGCHLGIIGAIMAITGKSREDAVELARNEAGAQSIGDGVPGLWVVDSLEGIHVIKGKEARFVKSWEYRSATGVVLGGTARYDTPSGKQYFPWRPAADGRFVMKRVAPPLPLFHMERLGDAKIVLVVEGEKVAERAQRLFDEQMSGHGVVTTCWMGGARAVLATDWAPLHGKDVFVWPDNDAQGEIAANDVATVLDGKAKSVRRVKPDPKWKSKVDLYDLIEDSGWDAQRVSDHMANHHHVGPRPPEPPRADVPSVADNRYFKILGYIFLPKSGCQIVVYEKQTSTVHTVAKALSPVDCLQIATSRDFWHGSFCPGQNIDVFGKRVLETIYEVMLRTAKTVGWFDTERLKGRGWHWNGDGNRTAVLNTGDRLIVDGKDRGLTEMSGQTVWLRKKAIDWGDSAAELPGDINRKVWEVFRLQMWDLPEQAYAVAGWVSIAPICGLLSFRPGLWLRGDAGMGKSYLGSFIRKLLGPTLRLTHGGSTEAGLRRTLYNDTVAFLIDEQESSNRSETINVEATLKLMRSCSGSEGAEILKADTSTPGGVTEGVLKTIMMFVSVGHQQLNDPNESRIFSALVARPPEMDKISFSRHALDKIRPAMEFATNGSCPPAAFLLWVRRNVARILESIRVGRDALVRAHGDFRFADLHGTLLGAGLFLRDNEVPDPEEVCEISDALASRQSASKTSDHIMLIHRIMEHRVQLPQSVTSPAGGDIPASEEAVARDATLMALVMRASEEEVDGLPVSVDMAQKILAQNGILAGISRRSNSAIHRDNTRLYMAADHSTMRAALRGTRWDGSDYAAVLARTIGERMPNRLRFADRVEYGLHIELSAIPMYEGAEIPSGRPGEDDHGNDIPF